ncbi:hypothetical protein ACJJTC_010882 [Scirpophaga incertulas]
MNSKNNERDRAKLVIDNDAGGDDAMAIIMALLYEKYYYGPKLIALTTVNGNTLEENVYRNNQRILKVANRQDVPIYRGSKSALVITPDTNEYFGKDGMGDTGDEYTSELVPARTTGAVNALIELSKEHEGTLTVVALGALTNIALAIKMDPDFLGRLKHLYVAAGNINDETNTEAEFNAHMDVESYHVVASNANPEKVTFIPFSQVPTHLTREWREKVLGGIETDIMKALNKFERVALEQSKQWLSLDPAAVAIVLDENLVDNFRYSNNSISLCGK